MSRRGWVLFLSMAVIWGIPYLLIKVAVEELHPAVVVAVRCALGSLLLVPIALARGGFGGLRGHWRWVVLFALVEITAPFLLLSFAEIRLSSSLTGLLVAMVPLLAAVAARLVGLDRIDARRAVGLLVGLAGVALLVGVDVRGGDLLAVLAVVGAAVGYAAGPILLATRLRQVPSLPLTAVALALAAAVVAPWAVVERPPDPGAVTAEAWLSVATLGVVCSAVALLVFFALVAEVGPARAAVITYLNPVVALALGALLLGEAVTLGMIVGFPVILAGSWLATSRRSGRPMPPDPGDPGDAADAPAPATPVR
ncbi:MAG: DMT family transporter [Kineosporiaceae bacterium]